MFKKEKIARLLLLVILLSSLFSPIRTIARSIENGEEQLLETEGDKDLDLDKDKEEDVEDKEEDVEDKEEDVEDKEEDVEDKEEDIESEEEDVENDGKEPETIYVDQSSKKEKEDGSKDYPYKTMNQAIEHSQSRVDKKTIIKVREGKYEVFPENVGTEGIATLGFREDIHIIGDRDYIKGKNKVVLDLHTIFSVGNNFNLENIDFKEGKEAFIGPLGSSGINNIKMKNINNLSNLILDDFNSVDLENIKLTSEGLNSGRIGIDSTKKVKLKNIENLKGSYVQAEQILVENVDVNGLLSYSDIGDVLENSKLILKNINLENPQLGKERNKLVEKLYPKYSIEVNGFDEVEIDGLSIKDVDLEEINSTKNKAKYQSGINIKNVDQAKLKDIKLINNRENIIKFLNSNYKVEDLKIIQDQDAEYDGVVRSAIESSSYEFNPIEDVNGKKNYQGEIDGVKVDLKSNKIENELDLNIKDTDLLINRMGVESSKTSNLFSSLNLKNSDFTILNSKLGNYKQKTNLGVKISNSKARLINNTLANQNLVNLDLDGNMEISNSILDLDRNQDKKQGSFNDFLDSEDNIIISSDKELVSKYKDTSNMIVKDYKDIYFNSDIDLQISDISPAINRGNNEHYKDFIGEYPKDLLGKDRIIKDRIDIGAYEYKEIEEPEKPEKPEEPEKPEIPEFPELPEEPEEPEIPEEPEEPEIPEEPEEPEIPEKPEFPEFPEIPEFPEVPEEPEKPELNKKEHFAYITGYRDGSVGPENEMLREEVAAVFFRLLDPEYRESIRQDSHNFPDFPKDKWSAKHIGTLAEGGILEGNEDGDFLPDRPISRAEIAVIAVRFDDGKGPRAFKSKFKDIEGHWAEEEIKKAEELGWLIGDENGNFNPDEKVSRGELITMVNRVLNRKVRKENILEGVRVFTDLEVDKWYYEDMVEATNGHIYNEERFEDGSEEWLELKDFNIEM